MTSPTTDYRRPRPAVPARRIVAPTPEDDDPTTTKMAAALRREVAKWYCERGITK